MHPSIYASIHPSILSRPQKTSRLDRKFLFGMAALSGLNQKTCRTPMLTMRAQCGDRTSTRCHVAKALLRQLERMADTVLPYAKPYHQAPFWKFLYAWRCRSLSSTSSLFSGILCSSAQQHRRYICVRADAEVCWQPCILMCTNVCVSNPAGMSPSFIRRTNHYHIQS